jgi:hypothetical protein
MRRHNNFTSLAFALATLLAIPLVGRAAVPEWLRAAARLTLPTYSAETDAVVLLDEGTTVVKEDGDIETTSREAIRILRPEGKHYGVMAIPFDNETRLTYLKGWSIGAKGEEYEVKEKDAVESAQFDGMILYSDDRMKTLSIPGVEPGVVIGFEYVHKERPTIDQAVWYLQRGIPVVRSHFTLRLPPGWEFATTWVNYPEQKPIVESSHETTWEIQNLPAIEWEPMMPSVRAIAGRLAITFFSQQTRAAQKSHMSWQDVGKWYGGLVGDRRQASPGIKSKTQELTSHAAGSQAKIQALSEFVQKYIRYVAIEIGIGGFQPHPAADIYSNLYGDCKDKATLLSSMLREAGIDSYYIVVHTHRGSVAPEFPTPLTFNHVILAIKLPDDISPETYFATLQHPKLGRLLIFDPTDTTTPVGALRGDLQDNNALLVTGDGGDLIRLPLLAPGLNRLLRSATLTLKPDGSLEGGIQEIRWGDHAGRLRDRLIDATAADRQKVMEELVSQYLGGVAFQQAEVLDLEDFSKPLVLRYRFVARNYAKTAGNLLLVRPRVIGGARSSGLLEGKERKNPVEFRSPSLESDLVDITLPPGYQVDELPPATTADCGFLEYKSNVKMEGNVLKYQRNYSVKSLLVPMDKLPELKTFYRQVAGDERNNAVLKRIAP